ncbi:Dabb family protein [Cellulophaga sp. Hel_I_12]|uniref:Dabb family protein n=1 Tax=Cellulophaga sp. Hel_I_12 TaxID=1249972 RepID=UPI000645BA8D|nr:Dabb family protein [Cellulophaga sp. Hel_I_12]
MNSQRIIKPIVKLSVLLLFSLNTFGQTENTIKTFDSNFAHTVYFWLKNPDNSQDCKAFEVALQKFLDTSKFAKTKFIGKPPKASRDVVDGSFTYALVVTFESAEAQEAYQKEPPHVLFIEEASQLWEKVLVYDATGI